jgi:hypothetical protein
MADFIAYISSIAIPGRGFVHLVDLPAWAFRLCSGLIVVNGEAQSW